MYKRVLQGISAAQKCATEVYTEPVLGGDEKSGFKDEKSHTAIEETAMDYVNKTHDFTEISSEDLSAVFHVLRKRCPQSWTQGLEDRAWSFHKKIMILKSEKNLSKYIDPHKQINSSVDSKDAWDAKDLIISPELWNMETTEAGIELKMMLHYITIYAPFKGRPFIRAWLETLVPCFSHWILRSYLRHTLVLETLKKFLGAFGQDGIVVCLADKGSTLLNSLQDAARSVEAIGRGTVEHYYWQQLAETNCGGKPEWRELASIPSWSQDLSQLDCLPEDWLLDCTDFVHVFANIVSPEISDRFEGIIHEKISGTKLNANIKVGPPKTYARSIAKCHQYRTEYLADSKLKRWFGFEEKFKKWFGRSPNKAEDFVWNVLDFARCSITVHSAREVLMVKKLIEESFLVVCVKNAYNANVEVKGSGYRDLKLFIQVEFDYLNLKNVPQVTPKTKIICEIQILCETWLENKLTTSLSYKILRAANLRELLSDFSKYVEKRCTSANMPKATEVLKNGWLNLVKTTEFSDINSDGLLLKAARYGWNVGGIAILVKKLKANLETKSGSGATPLILAASSGHDKLVKTVIDLKSNLDAKTNGFDTALHRAVINSRESCIQILLDAGASVDSRTKNGKTPLEYALIYYPNNKRILQLLQGHRVKLLGTKSDVKVRLIDKLESAAVEGLLANHFDTINVPRALVSKLFTKVAVATKVENILQVLWFGGNIGCQDAKGRTALYFASKHGDVTSVITLLDERADANVTTALGLTPLHIAMKMNSVEVTKILIAAGSDIEATTNYGMTPMHIAAKHGKHQMVPILLAAGAKINAKTKNGLGPLDLATNEKTRKALQVGLVGARDIH